MHLRDGGPPQLPCSLGGPPSALFTSNIPRKGGSLSEAGRFLVSHMNRATKV
jgi:hypothetical protein